MKLKLFFFLLIVLTVTNIQGQTADTLTLSLEKCRKMALQNSRELRRAENKVRQAELTRKEMLTHFFPQIEGSAMGLYAKDMDILHSKGDEISLSLLLRGVYLCGFQLAQPLFVGGKIANGYKLTKTAEGLAQEQQRQQRASLLVDVETNYWTYLAVLGKLDMLTELKLQLDTLLVQVASTVGAGMATDYDLLQVQSAHSNIVYQLQRVQSGTTLCRLALSHILGVNADSLYILPDSTAINSALMKALNGINNSADISQRPEVRLLQGNVKISELQVKMALADYLPTLGFSLGYTWFGNIKLHGEMNIEHIGEIRLRNPFYATYTHEFSSSTPILIAQLKIPLTNWWEGAYKIKKAKIEVENSKLLLEENTELMRLEVKQAELNLSESHELIHSASIALRTAEEQLRIANNRYAAGLAPLSDLFNAQSSYSQAVSNYLESRTQCLIYHVKYLCATGCLE